MLNALRTLGEKAATTGALVTALGRHAIRQGRPPSYRNRPPLRIAIDLSPAMLPAPSGLGRYITLLAGALIAEDTGNDYTLLLAKSGACPITTGRARARRLRFPVTILERLAGPPRIEVATGPIDLFHCQLGFTPPFIYGPLVVTIHDILPLLRPEAFRGDFPALLRAHATTLAKAATLVITGSHSAAREITRVLPVSDDRVRVIPHAPDPRFQEACPPEKRAAMRAALRLAGPYVLSLGTVSLHKNHARLVRGFAAIAREVPHTLVIAGRPDTGWDEVTRAIQETGLSNRVCLLGFTPDEHLPALVAEADLLAQPSLYEGFGLPVLDAMAAGIPVACSNASAIPEVAGAAAEYFDPQDLCSIADALRLVLTDADRHEALRHAGRAHAAGFTWEKTARLTAKVYVEAALLHRN